MGLPSKKTSLQTPVKISPQERDHIIRTRVNLDYITAIAQHAVLYKNLGWSPVALDAQAGTGFQVDFDQPEATWTYWLMKLILKQARISLAIRIEPDSRLFVLKVNAAFGKEYLNSLGDWRSPCMAQAEDSWENHFLVLPQPWCFSSGPSGDSENTPLSVIAPGSLVLVPPSRDPASRETWHWLHPPWEHPPWHPSPGLLLLLEEIGYIVRRNLLPEEDFPTWEVLYPIISASPKLLQALMTPLSTREFYYQTILYEAIQAGLRHPRTLKALLWHAPHGVTGRGPEARQQLSQWAAEIQRLLAEEELQPMGAATSPATEQGWKELNLLAALAAELEQQVDELERQQLSSEVAAVCSPSPCQLEESASPSPATRKNWEELEELRGALKEFLSKYTAPADSR